MASRNCETRPVAWKTNYNKELAEASKEVGFEVWPFFIGCITSRDNLGRLEGDEYQLKGMFFPDVRYPQVTVDRIRQIRDCLVGKGLIIVYEIKGVKYMVLPKIGEYSDIVGNMSSKSDYPAPPEEIIKEWEARMNDVYTPCERRSYGVCTEVEVEVEGKVEGKDKEVLSGKTARLKQVFSDPTTKLLNDVYKKGFNIFAMLSKWRKDHKFDLPEKVIAKVCGYYNGNTEKITNPWPWFVAALERASREYWAETHAQENDKRKREKMPQSFKDILAGIVVKA